MLFSHNRRMSRISQIKRLTRQITDRQEGKRKQKWSQIAPRSSMPQFVAWPTDWFPGPPRAIAYLCTTRATLTALQTEDIWPIFCFSCPFMSFEAQRKSQYAKLIQFFVANFRLWSRCRHFLIEWPSFVAISFGRCRYFFAHVACRNLPWQGLIAAPQKFDESSQLKQIFAREASRVNMLVLRTSNFQWATIRPIVSRSPLNFLTPKVKLIWKRPQTTVFEYFNISRLVCRNMFTDKYYPCRYFPQTCSMGGLVSLRRWTLLVTWSV